MNSERCSKFSSLILLRHVVLDTNPWIVLLKFMLVTCVTLSLDYLIANPDTVTSTLMGLVHVAPCGLLGLSRGLESFLTGVGGALFGVSFSIAFRLMGDSAYLTMLAVVFAVCCTTYALYLSNCYHPGIFVAALFSSMYVVLVQFSWKYMSGPFFETWPEVTTLVIRILCLAIGIACAFCINLIVSGPFQHNIFSSRLFYINREFDKAVADIPENPLSPQTRIVFDLISDYLSNIEEAHAELRFWALFPCTYITSQTIDHFKQSTTENLRQLCLRLAIALSQNSLTTSQSELLNQLLIPPSNQASEEINDREIMADQEV